MDPNTLNELIRTRRAVFPAAYNDKPIPKEILHQILENGNWAPNHKKTEPWRFKVMTGSSLEQFSQFITEWYIENTPEEKFSEIKLRKMNKKPLQSTATIAICMQRDQEERIPEWQELAAVACAVQNMWLTATAYGIGTYWATPKFAEDMNEFLDLKEGERCYGFMYMGYSDVPLQEGNRGDIAEKVKWL